MPSTASPFGLQPAYHPSGVIRPEAGQIVTGYNTAIYQFSPVKIGTDGYLQLAAVNDRFIGVFMGVEYTDTSGRPIVTNRWTANTSATAIVAYYTRDPAIVYAIQSNAALAITDMGKQYDMIAQAGNATTGLSSVSLDVASSAANAALRVIGLRPDANNAWDDTYTNVFVEISEHQDVADVAAY